MFFFFFTMVNDKENKILPDLFLYIYNQCQDDNYLIYNFNSMLQ